MPVIWPARGDLEDMKDTRYSKDSTPVKPSKGDHLPELIDLGPSDVEDGLSQHVPGWAPSTDLKWKWDHPLVLQLLPQKVLNSANLP